MFRTRSYISDEWCYIFSGGHSWAKVGVGICKSRGHDVFVFENAYCYNCKKHFVLGDSHGNNE